MNQRQQLAILLIRRKAYLLYRRLREQPYQRDIVGQILADMISITRYGIVAIGFTLPAQTEIERRSIVNVEQITNLPEPAKLFRGDNNDS